MSMTFRVGSIESKIQPPSFIEKGEQLIEWWMLMASHIASQFRVNTVVYFAGRISPADRGLTSNESLTKLSKAQDVQSDSPTQG